MKANPNRLWIVAIFLGWSFDFLFWRHVPGLNFALFVLLCLAGGLYLLVGEEKVKPSRGALWLLIPIIFFAAVTFIRAEPMTSFLAHALTLFLLGVFAITYLGGRWILYSLWDYILGFLKLGGNMLVKPLTFSQETRRERLERGDPPKRSAWPVIRGLIIALPIVAIFAALLSSADAVFSQRLQDVLEALNLDNIPEYIFRLSYILVFGYLLAGVFLHAATQSKDETVVGEQKSLLGQFLGFIEAAIVLGSVATLFISFVVIQFQYFFGGQANVHIDGFTYSEYARRGFGELVAVAFFSLLLILVAGAVTKRENDSQRKTFSGLSIGIVLLVLVMLVSAYKRLVLYETAYGFSELRTYTHVFMIWLGALLIATVVLEILRRERMFAFAALVAALGFAATLPILNVDAFIVRQNVQRELSGQAEIKNGGGRFSLDSGYFLDLSDDAVPVLAGEFRNPSLPSAIKEELGAVLLCYQGQRIPSKRFSWQSFKLSRLIADQTFTSLRIDFKSYNLDNSDFPSVVTTPSGKEFNCF